MRKNGHHYIVLNYQKHGFRTEGMKQQCIQFEKLHLVCIAQTIIAMLHSYIARTAFLGILQHCTQYKRLVLGLQAKWRRKHHFFFYHQTQLKKLPYQSKVELIIFFIREKPAMGPNFSNALTKRKYSLTAG